MAEQEQDRSESATPFKLQEARRRGQVPKSLELNSLFAVLGLLLVMAVWGRDMLHDQMRLDALVFGQAHQLDFEFSQVMRWLAELFLRTLYGLAPLLVAVVVSAVAANLLQTGPVFTTFPLEPDADRINPVAGFKRLFNWRMLFELLKNLVKLVFFTVALWVILRDLMMPLFGLLQIAPRAYLDLSYTHALGIVFKLAMVLVAIAIADLIYTRWHFADNQKMSRREVREEVKHREGDPRIRARMRELRKETLARSQALRRLPEADVLITNPTHLAVALLYRQETMAAPLLIAKGAGEMAEQMKAMARRHRVPIVENRTLARALFAGAAVDQKIPDAFFAPVARLLVWVYAMRDRSASREQAA